MQILQDREDFMIIDREREELTQKEKERLIRKCYELREKFGLMNISEDELIISALKMYERQKNRVLRNKLKRGNNLK